MNAKRTKAAGGRSRAAEGPREGTRPRAGDARRPLQPDPDGVVRTTLDEVIRRGGGRTDWARLRRKTDEEIAAAVASDPDAAPLLDEEWFANAEWAFPEGWPAGKQAISLRVDRDVLEWFKAQGPRYQSRINAVLRAYVNAKTRRAG